MLEVGDYLSACRFHALLKRPQLQLKIVVRSVKCFEVEGDQFPVQDY
jgi:hypothetical protein